MVSFQIRQQTRVPINADVVWQLVTTLEGINAELRPLMTMTTPPHWPNTSLSEVEVPIHLGKSWIFAGGVLLVDYDDLSIVELGKRRFKEESTMLSASSWVHERIVHEDTQASATIEDIVTVTPRKIIAATRLGVRVHRFVISTVFKHRHRRIARLYTP